MNRNAPRFFLGRENIGPDEITIEGGDARHISASLRMGIGNIITVCDGEGTDYICELASVSSEKAVARIVQQGPNAGEPRVKVTLYQSLPRADKFEFVIQKCVEAGVHRITPILSDYSQFHDRSKGEGGMRLLARWRKIAGEAAKQSGRGIMPEICGFMRFAEAAVACTAEPPMSQGRSTAACTAGPPMSQERSTAACTAGPPMSQGHMSAACQAVQALFNNDALALILYEGEAKTSLKSILQPYKSKTEHANPMAAPIIHIFAGPEGGFSESEINHCIKLGIMPVTLGDRILRSETAGLFAISQIMYEFEQ